MKYMNSIVMTKKNTKYSTWIYSISEKLSTDQSCLDIHPTNFNKNKI